MQTEATILTVDKEPLITRLIKLELSTQGYRVVKAESAEEALSKFTEINPDLVLAEIILQEDQMNGFELLKKLREIRNVPFIFVTMRADDLDKVKGLEMGADDYVSKPFSPKELTARCRAILRRSERAALEERLVVVGGLQIDLLRRVVTLDNTLVRLPPYQWRLLEELAIVPGRVLYKTELLTKVWGPEYNGDFDFLRTHLSRLRRRLGDTAKNPRYILTSELGYYLAQQ